MLILSFNYHFDFGREPRTKTGFATVLRVNMVCGDFIPKWATAFYKLPMLTLMFAKLKEHSLPTDVLLLSRGIKTQKGSFVLSVKSVFLCQSFVFLELAPIDATWIRLCGFCSLPEAWLTWQISSTGCLLAGRPSEWQHRRMKDVITNAVLRL